MRSLFRAAWSRYRVPPLADGWTEHVDWIWWTAPDYLRGRLAVCFFDRQLILYALRIPWLAAYLAVVAGLALLTPWTLPVSLILPVAVWAVVRHERGHSHGIEACLSGSAGCVMAEEDQHGDAEGWAGKARLLPYQIATGGAYCAACAAHLDISTGRNAHLTEV